MIQQNEAVKKEQSFLRSILATGVAAILMSCKDKVQESQTSATKGIGKYGQKLKTINKSQLCSVIVTGDRQITRNRCVQPVMQPVSGAKRSDTLV